MVTSTQQVIVVTDTSLPGYFTSKGLSARVINAGYRGYHLAFRWDARYKVWRIEATGSQDTHLNGVAETPEAAVDWARKAIDDRIEAGVGTVDAMVQKAGGRVEQNTGRIYVPRSVSDGEGDR